MIHLRSLIVYLTLSRSFDIRLENTALQGNNLILTFAKKYPYEFLYNYWFFSRFLHHHFLCSTSNTGNAHKGNKRDFTGNVHHFYLWHCMLAHIRHLSRRSSHDHFQYHYTCIGSNRFYVQDQVLVSKREYATVNRQIDMQRP